MSEREGAVTFQGGPLTLVGPELQVGDQAPDFNVIDGGLGAVTLASSAGKVRLISAVPSLDTPVCSDQTKRFAEALGGLPENVEVLTISADLPFAQGRWCGAEGVEMTTLSDHRELSFANAYGVLIKELQLLSRAIFVIDAEDKIAYLEIVSEVTDHPNYDAALAAAGGETGNADAGGEADAGEADGGEADAGEADAGGDDAGEAEAPPAPAEDGEGDESNG